MKKLYILFFIITGICICADLINMISQYKNGNASAVYGWFSAAISMIIAIICRIDCYLIEKFKK